MEGGLWAGPCSPFFKKFFNPFNLNTMEVLFFIIFGGMLLFFIGYGIALCRQDKKILNEIQDQADGRILGGEDNSEEGSSFLDSEWPFVDCYKSLN